MSGTKVHIDESVLKPAAETKPPYMSRVAWINFLILQGIAAVEQKKASGND